MLIIRDFRGNPASANKEFSLIRVWQHLQPLITSVLDIRKGCLSDIKPDLNHEILPDPLLLLASGPDQPEPSPAFRS